MKKTLALAGLFILLGVAGIAFAQMANSNYRGNGGLLWVIGAELQHPAQTVALTSPTVTIPVNDKSHITVTTDANQTGATLTGGQTGQIVYLVTGAGSNTLRLDDNGTTLALGADKTITEGEGDALVLICTGVSTVTGLGRWSLLSDQSGN